MNLKLTDVINKIRSGQLKGEDAHKALSCFINTSDSDESDVIHFLHHYVADADIREGDHLYRKHQELHLDKLLKTLTDKFSD